MLQEMDVKILFVMHADFEKPGYIEEWARRKGHLTRTVRPYKGENLSDIHDFNFLVVMGGPQSPLAMSDAPYLADEIELIKRAIINHKRIIGVCLGAQLIAEALGAKTERSPNREIGMYPVELLDAAKLDPVFQQFPQKFNVMHWHSDMPGLAEGAVLLAKSEGCPRQVFRYGDRIYGFQCHFEMTLELISGMIGNCPGDLTEETYIKTADELMQSDCNLMNEMMSSVLNYLESLPEIILQK
jgi:GMP synthase (glutamine-hydrolysing)